MCENCRGTCLCKNQIGLSLPDSHEYKLLTYADLNNIQTINSRALHRKKLNCACQNNIAGHSTGSPLKDSNHQSAKGYRTDRRFDKTVRKLERCSCESIRVEYSLSNRALCQERLGCIGNNNKERLLMHFPASRASFLLAILLRLREFHHCHVRQKRIQHLQSSQHH